LHNSAYVILTTLRVLAL